MKCLIQGYQGSFHEAAVRKYFPTEQIEVLPADTFDQLAKRLDDGEADMAIMAIENSIAGSILQNYRILREHNFWISGEVYLRIQHQLMALEGQEINQLTSVMSHPMALNQCLEFLNGYPQMGRKEHADTALAAKDIAEQNLSGVACIASEIAASIYGLKILAKDIETDDHNYTRFFIIKKEREDVNKQSDQASIYIRLAHEKGSLLKVLQTVMDQDINLSKLQSFPVLGSPKEYYFYLDLEYQNKEQFLSCYSELERQCLACETLGIYRNAKFDMINQMNKKLAGSETVA